MRGERRAVWHREDTAYAAAAAGAVALVGYLLAANFGLVPSPLSFGLVGGRPAEVTVRAIGAAAVDVFLPNSPTAPPSSTRPPIGTTPPSADRSAPNLGFTTRDGTQYTTTEPAVVAGRASDRGTGIARVIVTFSSQSGDKTETAKLSCRGSAATSCSWTAKVPDVVGAYTVTARATDRAGNAGKAHPIEVTVVNAGGPVDELKDMIGEPGTSGSLPSLDDTARLAP